MTTQTFETHRYRPTFWLSGFLAGSLALVLMLWTTARSLTLANVTLLLLVYAAFTAIYLVRRYALNLQDSIIRLEMQVRLASLGRQGDLARLKRRQVVALRFASDAELPALLERAIAEQLTDDQIKRAITGWQPDHLRT